MTWTVRFKYDFSVVVIGSKMTSSLSEVRDVSLSTTNNRVIDIKSLELPKIQFKIWELFSI